MHLPNEKGPARDFGIWLQVRVKQNIVHLHLIGLKNDKNCDAKS